MSGSTTIVHIVSRDKFTAGYINFMKLRMTEWEHHFFVAASGIYEVNPVDEQNIHYYSGVNDITSGHNLELLRSCSKIIISGVGNTRLLLALRREFTHKTYLQFWGGDFYDFRYSRHPKNPIRLLKWLVKRYIHHQFIKKCAGTISLISTDIDALNKIFPSSTKHFTARMPWDVLEHHTFDVLASRKHDGSSIRILAGNSAQRPNEHSGIFQNLAHLKDADIEILSPLSYGEEDYRDEVITLGRKIFGGKFTPIIDFIPKEKYVEFLASCDAAVFNQNQQAALGNIWLMLRLGRKVYIRENTSMWQDFKSQGAVIYPVAELAGADIASLADMPEKDRKINMALTEEYLSGKQTRKEWETVLND